MSASIPSFGALYAFGDSLSDAGDLSISSTDFLGAQTPNSPYYQESYKTLIGPQTAHVFSNGPTWVQDLSQTLGLGTLAPSLLAGNDFAYGGAETGATPQNAGDAASQAISLPSQLVQFNVLDPAPAANALYTISIGANDLLDILANPTLSAAQQTTDINDAVANEMTFIGGLAHDGAKNLLVLNVPDLGKTPDVMDGLANGSDTPSAAFDALASALSSEYNSALTVQLAAVASADGLDVHVVDLFHLIDSAAGNPSAYGLSNVTTPVWSGTYTGANGALAATGAAQDQYLFFDHLHPTETGESAVATLALAALNSPTACFAAGTRIATASGEVPVEALRPGDLVRLATGGTAPVVWLGHRRVECRGHPRPDDVRPVRIAAHAFGLGRPARDVRLSPDHAVYVDGVLIPVRYLLNAATVRQEDAAAITYWHVELPTHGVLLAERLPAESYLDTGNRAAFANGGGAAWAHPDFARTEWARAGCAPLVTHGPARDTVYRRLLAQAAALGWRAADAGDGAVTWAAPFRSVASTAKANARSVLGDIRGALATASASEALAPVG